ncbi:sugar transferase [Mucilaginibacter panaciglaebae]|uniref:Sugar transferase n=1 Tax=Mucilaginibacter panaciglaebae TaxID=502331 RepID=A0ABP7WE41_9SPHI
MYARFVKRFVDITVAVLSLLALAPLLAAIYLVLWTNGENPLFFQCRVGRNKKVFRLIKFRSMKTLYGPDGLLLDNRFRITPIGRILRKTSLDELPQLINIIKGDMSFIGPRPLMESYLPFYTETEQLRHHLRPGITGWAQINGRNNLSWDIKLAFDIYYVKNLSFFLDCYITLKTAIYVIQAKDVQIDDPSPMLYEERQRTLNAN